MYPDARVPRLKLPRTKRRMKKMNCQIILRKLFTAPILSFVVSHTYCCKHYVKCISSSQCGVINKSARMRLSQINNKLIKLIGMVIISLTSFDRVVRNVNIVTLEFLRRKMRSLKPFKK